MDTLKLISSLAMKNDRRIVMLVIDGLGGAPHAHTFRTELESARIPTLDELARRSLCGLSVPVDYGITPGSGPGHLALFGYDPLQYLIGRGVLEVLGLGMQMTGRDVAFRGNFATMDNGIVTDRRAGRIPTELCAELCTLLSREVPRVGGVEVLLQPGKGHRFAGILRGDDLGDAITENDPHKEGNKPHAVQAVDAADAASARTAAAVTQFLARATEVLKDRRPANYVLMRGFSRYPSIPRMQEAYKLAPACIAVYPMYKGLAQLVGMDIVTGCESMEQEFDSLEKRYAAGAHDFFFVHLKDTDAMGEDGNFDGKVAKLQEIDALMPRLLALKPDVLIVTGDHATPAVNKGHAWHPVPFLIHSAGVPTPRDTVQRFTERECARATGGVIPATKLMPIAMAYAGKLDKFGA